MKFENSYKFSALVFHIKQIKYSAHQIAAKDQEVHINNLYFNS